MACSSFLASTPAFATCWALRSALPIAVPMLTATRVSLLFLAIFVLRSKVEPIVYPKCPMQTTKSQIFISGQTAPTGEWRGRGRQQKMTWLHVLCDSSLPRKGEAKHDAEKIQGSDGKRDSGDRHRGGRRRRADLRGVRGCAARRISFDGADVRGDARRRGGAPRPSIRDVPATIRGAHSADPAGKRERVLAEETGVARAAAGGERGAEASGINGDGGGAVLRASREQDGGRFHAGIAEQAGGRGEKTQANRGRAGRKTPDRE